MPHGKTTFLTGKEIAFIIANHKGMYITQMARHLGRHPDTVSKYLKEHGIKAMKQIVVSSRLVPEGEVVIFKRNGAPMFYVKTSGKFKLLHHHIWQQVYGDIPPGYVISFKDHDMMNVDPSNLVLVSRKKWLSVNTINQWPPEIRDLIKLSSRLKHTLNEQQSSNSKTSAVQRTDRAQRSGPQREPAVT